MINKIKKYTSSLISVFTLRIFIGILVIIIIAFLGSFFIYQYSQNKKKIPTYLKKNNATQNSIFTVYNLNHKPITLTDLKNKVVIINFWATWCAPCIEELPSLNILASYYPKKLVILAVSNENIDDIYNFLMAFPRFNTNFIPSNIEQSKMRSFFNVRAFPETYILDKTGKTVDKIVGQQKWNSKRWKNKIKTLINQK